MIQTTKGGLASVIAAMEKTISTLEGAEEIQMRVWGVDTSKIYDGATLNALQDHYLGDDEFMELSEAHGLIWSLEGFAHAYNTDDIKSTIYIRFI